MIFDSLGHPTISEKWLDRNIAASFDNYVKQIKDNSFIGGMAVGLAGKDLYSHEKYIDFVNSYDCLYGVAGVHPSDISIQLINDLKHLGYKAIKIHCRFSNVSPNDVKILSKVFSVCEKENFPIYYCTYAHSSIKYYPISDPFYTLVELLKITPKVKVVLVHGGDIAILKYAELVRANENLLLDLSLTICKYEGSSVDLDINFLFSNFDKRICVGSDHPEWSLKKLKDRFNFFSKEINNQKRINIGYQNIMKFLNIN